MALKACKGHTEALLMGAAAQKYGLFLCVQDLTCTGASFLHSASLSARIPTVAAIEGNGRQYCPAGNAGWDQRYPGMFNITDGTVETGCLVGKGCIDAIGCSHGGTETRRRTELPNWGRCREISASPCLCEKKSKRRYAASRSLAVPACIRHTRLSDASNPTFNLDRTTADDRLSSSW